MLDGKGRDVKVLSVDISPVLEELGLLATADRLKAEWTDYGLLVGLDVVPEGSEELGHVVFVRPGGEEVAGV